MAGVAVPTLIVTFREMNGADIMAKGVDLSFIRRKMGMVFQSFNLFSHRMVIKNLMMAYMEPLSPFRKEAYDEAMRLLRMVGLTGGVLTISDCPSLPDR